MIHYLTIGTVLGLSAGFAPGPLLTLVISETLQHDIKSGIKVSLAPIITDLPIIILTLFILSKLSNFHNILGLISLTGGLFILFMGYKSLRTKGVKINLDGIKPKSLIKGVLANALSPHPYLFWFTVGAPIMTKAMLQNISAPLAFIISFYTFLVGSKIVLAILIGKSKSLLSGKMYIFTMRFLGLVLCVLAIVLFRDGLKLLEII
ncbi:MAG: LysE family transporter [Proteobacteria bacterium]|nr:LysE family transporter [Pseudomonadota bacterium]